jgi:Ca2+-binding RTX toxin-like protein
VTIRVADHGGLFFDKSITIGLTDVGREFIVGDAANNTFVGGALKDAINAGAGNDIVTGGLQKDLLTGGPGNDIFKYNSVKDSGTRAATRDVITDFRHNIDEIDLKTIDANIKKFADQAFKFIGATGFHNVKGELHYFKIDNTGTKLDKTIIEGDVNGDGKADFQIELSHLVSLSKGDFIL